MLILDAHLHLYVYSEDPDSVSRRLGFSYDAAWKWPGACGTVNAILFYKGTDPKNTAYPLKACN